VSGVAGAASEQKPVGRESGRVGPTTYGNCFLISFAESALQPKPTPEGDIRTWAVQRETL